MNENTLRAPLERLIEAATADGCVFCVDMGFKHVHEPNCPVAAAIAALQEESASTTDSKAGFKAA